MNKTLLFIACACVLSGCGKPKCTNDNPAFEQYGPTSYEYKSELVKQIQQRERGSIRYWVDKYTEINGKPFMIVDIQSEGLCAKGYIDIKNPNKVQHFKNVKGISYSGAEIKNFQYKIDTVEGKILFLWEEGRIMD